MRLGCFSEEDYYWGVSSAKSMRGCPWYDLSKKSFWKIIFNKPTKLRVPLGRPLPDYYSLFSIGYGSFDIFNSFISHQGITITNNNNSLTKKETHIILHPGNGLCNYPSNQETNSFIIYVLSFAVIASIFIITYKYVYNRKPSSSETSPLESPLRESDGS